MASEDWEDTKAELARLAVATYRAAKKETSAFVADHPEIKQTAERAKAEGLKSLMDLVKRLRPR
jgi:quinol monooxygenase YgiN